MQVELDPVRYEIYRHRLFNILEEGRIAMKMVSGSAVVVEGGETMTCFCETDGTPILIAAGILLHAMGAIDFIRKAIELYEVDPGFDDGDQLFFNDPYLGGQHQADMVIIKPIFYQGRRIAWSASIMHTSDVGAMEPSSNVAGSTDIFQEGIRIQGLKIMEKGKLRRDVYNTIIQHARDSHLLALDTKAKIAANNACGRGYLQLVKKFGIEFIEAASKKIISDSERMARDKLAGLPDGKWRSRLYGDVAGLANDRPYKVFCTMTKERDEITFDFTGSSPQVEGSLNCTLPATWGQLFVPLTSQLFWNIPWNKGLFAPVKLVAPEGSIVNCRFPAACSSGVSTVGCFIQETAHECIAKMLYAGGLYEDVNSAWRGGAGGHWAFGGINQYGTRSGGTTLDTFGCGIGAAPYRDGVDTGGNMMNPSSCISDVEIIEHNLPWMYLARRNARDSGGFGKFSGGMAPEMIYMSYGGTNIRTGLRRFPRRTLQNWGMFGGYPSAPGDSVLVQKSRLPELLQQSKIPTSIEDLALLDGTIFDPPFAYTHYQATEQYDLVFSRLGAGGGYGDPLDRDPMMVLADFKRGAISLDIAVKIYGVAIDEETLKIDSEEMVKLRQALIAERLRQGKTLKESKISANIKGEPKFLLRMHEYLEVVEIDQRKIVRCIKCRYLFCDADENYKEYALLRERALTDINLRSPKSEQTILLLYQEYICPGCGTLLDVDNVCPELDPVDERILWDIQLKL